MLRQRFWQEIFGNPHPVEVEIGPGKGGFLLAMARSYPQRNFFGIERSRRKASRLSLLIKQEGLANVIVIHADATCILFTLIPPESVSAYHIYFPDPWWKKRHHKHRLFQGSLAMNLARTLSSGGYLFLATDLHDYLAEACSQIEASNGLIPFSWHKSFTTRRGKPILTDFERKCLERGRPLYYAAFQKVRLESPFTI